jgi:Ca2+-binding EF-hand superfamily protein
MFDKNGDGLISKSELAVVLKSMGRTPTEKELQAMVNNRKKFHNSFL